MATPATSVSTAPELLERADHLAALTALLDQVASLDGGRLCLIGAEAGGGKTALVRAFTGRLPVRRLLWGACDPLFTARPLGPFADIAEATGGRLRDLINGHARPHEVATALLGLLREAPPAVAVLEDIHWADEATLDVLRLLSRRIESAPGLLIATYRDDGLSRDHPLRAFLGETPRIDSVVRITLDPLSPTAVRKLASPHRVDPEELYRKTGGNPFFVTEVLASAGNAIPGNVRDAVLARASRLSTRARALLDAVAVMPLHAELAVLDAVSQDAFGALGECLDAGMLSRRNGAVTFRHQLARLAIEESIAPDRTMHLHRQTLRALTTSPHAAMDPARLAHHAAGAEDAAALLRFGREAGRRASALGAHREAAAQFSRTLTVAASLPERDHAELLEEYADECLHVSRVDDAMVAQERAVELFRDAGDPLHEAVGLCRLGRFYMCGVRGSEARAPINRAVEILETLPPGRELAFAHARLVMFHVNMGELKSAMYAARRAIELAEQLNDDELLLYNLNSLGSLELLMGDAAGAEKLMRSLEMADELGLDEEVGRAYLNWASAAVDARAYDGLLDLISRGCDYCSQHGLELWRMWLLTSQARALLDHGDWSGAADAADEVLHGERGQLPRISALPTLGLVRARRGDPHVWPVLDEAMAMAKRDGQLQFEAPIAVARAEAAWLEGRPGAVREETDAAMRKATAQDAWWYLGELTCWRRRIGVEDLPHPKLPERYTAELQGDFERAAQLWTALGCEYDAAMAMAASDDEALLKHALVKLQRLGARPAAAIVARKLRAAGVTSVSRGPRATTQRNPALLTNRELEVLGLIAGGMRNAEIAGRLFLAPKTVDHHVSAILRKLSVTNRAEAAREASRFGLLP
ncbi:MAG TPA: LuxR C-terminal-related transcriptional regulator [Candidatus Dormibacteraeota bacterium]|nr:LuxR C-terminal-related transcriptional regulator [Candidatus Dormibacteraeota bacterium]